MTLSPESGQVQLFLDGIIKVCLLSLKECKMVNPGNK